MDRLCIRHFSRANNGRNVEVTQGGRGRPDTNRLIGQFYVFGLGVGLGMHGHRFDTHFAAGTLHAQRNFTTIGNQDFFKHGE